mmetsp:Transcript_41345/g.82847  ORF Transcript_41345/g.82847 Transcript_41345/m.82847 type:complete len:106 (-) Transcript_41345:42-359(-)
MPLSCCNMDWGSSVLVCGRDTHTKFVQTADNWQVAVSAGHVERGRSVTCQRRWICAILQQKLNLLNIAIGSCSMEWRSRDRNIVHHCPILVMIEAAQAGHLCPVI